MAYRPDNLSEREEQLWVQAWVERGAHRLLGLLGEPADPHPVHPFALRICLFVRSANRYWLVPTLPDPLAVVDTVARTEGPVPSFHGAWSSEEEGQLSGHHIKMCNSRLLKGL